MATTMRLEMPPGKATAAGIVMCMQKAMGIDPHAEVKFVRVGFNGQIKFIEFKVGK